MSCTLRGGARTLQVCLNGPDALYRFGSTGKRPDLEVTTPVSALEYLPWPGIGRDIWETVTFSNGAFRYEVATGFSRIPQDDDGSDAGQPPVYGSVHVTENGAAIADLQCDAGTVEWGYGGGLSDAKSALGLCWTGYPDSIWRPCETQ